MPLGDGEYRFEHTNRKHIDALAGVLDRLGKGGMLKDFADMAGSSHSDGLVFDGRRYLKGKEAETLQAGGLLEAVPSKSGWDYHLTQEGRALAKVMARSRDAAADGKPAGRAQSARAKDTPVVGKAAVAKNAANEKPSSDKAAKPETFVKTALDDAEEAERKARVLQGEPVYTVKERTAPRENKALREWAVALFDKAGNKAVNPEIGEVALTAKSVKDSLAHGISPEKASAFEAVPYVVEKGAVIVRTRHGRVSSYFISAPVEIEGKQDIVTVLVHHDVNKKRMYLHSVTTKENLLKTALAGYDGDSTADAEASEPRGKLYSGDIASVLKKLLEYKTQGGKTENVPSEGLRFSLNESPDSAFAQAVDDAARGRQVSGYVRVGTTPDVLKMLGLPDVRVTVHGSMFKKVMGGKHSVTAEDLKQIPKQINSPVAVMKSETMADGYVVLTELVEHERGTDKPVVAALHLKRTKDGLELMNIASVYGRRDIQVQRGLNSHLLYLDKEKGLKLSRTFGLQLPAYVQEGSNLGSQVKTDSDLVQYLKAEKQGKFDKKQENAKQHAESIKKRLAESIGGLAEQVDVAAVSETAPDKAQMLLSERVEGWFDGRTGKITLVAENLTPERAVWVAWHELGHRGFAAEGFAKYREELERADGNSLIRRIADAVQEEREGTGDAAASVRSAAVEEAVVELYAAQRTGDWSGIENRYGVKVGNGLKRGIAGVLARIGAVLRRVLQRLAGKADGAMSDADVFAMLADLHGNAEGARDASSDGVKPSRSAMKDTDANIRRGRAAMNRALVEKADVRRAMYRNDIGWIDFVWGSTGRVLPNGKTKGAMGLAHVIESRMRKDGMSRDEVVGMLTNDIVEAIARGKVYKHVVNGNSERLQLRHNGYEANLIKNAGNNAWLITGYELYQNGADGVGFDTSAATHTTPTPARRDVGASDTPNVRAKDESVNTVDGVLFSIYSDDADKVARTAEPVRFADSFDSVRKQLGEVAGRLLTNRITGMTATISRKTINKMLSGKAHNKSVSLRAHLMAAVNADRLFENAIEGWVEADKGGSADVAGVHKMFAPLKVDNEILLVKLTVKELREAQGNRIYSVEAIDVSEHGNSHIPEMTEAGIISDTASHRLNVAGLDSLIRRIKDFNRKNASGSIADFDTEAVRFSRAANIGAAISHITGKRSDLRNALKDRWDASKGIQLQFLGRRQIEDIYGGSLDGLKEYGRLSELFGADANKAVTEADKVVREWGRLKKENAKALADLMHDATLAKVDADPLMRGDAQKRLDGIRTALDIADGKIEKAKAVIASANARIARADAAYNKASEAAKKAQSALLAAEEKAGREILTDEADMRLRRLFYADSEAKRALRHFNKI